MLGRFLHLQAKPGKRVSSTRALCISYRFVSSCRCHPACQREKGSDVLLLLLLLVAPFSRHGRTLRLICHGYESLPTFVRSYGGEDTLPDSTPLVEKKALRIFPTVGDVDDRAF